MRVMIVNETMKGGNQLERLIGSMVVMENN